MIVVHAGSVVQSSHTERGREGWCVRVCYSFSSSHCTLRFLSLALFFCRFSFSIFFFIFLNYFDVNIKNNIFFKEYFNIFSSKKYFIK